MWEKIILQLDMTQINLVWQNILICHTEEERRVSCSASPKSLEWRLKLITLASIDLGSGRMEGHIVPLCSQSLSWQMGVDLTLGSPETQGVCWRDLLVFPCSRVSIAKGVCSWPHLSQSSGNVNGALLQYLMFIFYKSVSCRRFLMGGFCSDPPEAQGRQ